MKLSDPISQLYKVGPRSEKRLEALGIRTIKDLLFYFPRDYEDFSVQSKISELVPGEKTSFVATVEDVSSRITFRGKRRLPVVNATLSDETGSVEAVWFNQVYVEDYLKIGSKMRFAGVPKLYKNKLSISSPTHERESTEVVHTQGLVPIYPETQGVTSKFLRMLTRQALEHVHTLSDWLPVELEPLLKIPSLADAIHDIHFPRSLEDSEFARRRFVMQKLFFIQLFLIHKRSQRQDSHSISVESSRKTLESFLSTLPFTLTSAQKKSLDAIISDIKKEYPMNRLLEGDVGSGKTIVAVTACFAVAKAGMQSAIMAPTEILAQQHFQELSSRLKGLGVSVQLMTSNQKKFCLNGVVQDLTPALAKKQILSGSAQILVGTHALIQKSVTYSNLALVVVDEQHRFGVAQRAALLQTSTESSSSKKKRSNEYTPHLLTMTATPIPRTLSLALYGDLDISLINESPKHKKQIITKVVSPKSYEKAYEFIRKQINAGRQAFFVYPLIDESQFIEAKAAKAEYERLQNDVFPDLNLALLHGQLKAGEKDEVMKIFKSRKADILVSTPVVEVGIDVPNATVMVIESSERFGLAQLHQFRGRVGRGEHQSYCLLFTDSDDSSSARLKALVRHASGFELAEQDLKIRGPGDFFGKSQSGIPDIMMRALKDPSVIADAQEVAQYAYKKSSDLSEFPRLKRQLERFTQNIHLE